MNLIRTKLKFHTLSKDLRLIFFLVGLVITNVTASPIFAAKLNAQAISQLETDAQNKSKIWSAESIREARDSFQKSAKLWENIRKFDSAAYCLREAGKLHLMLNTPEEAYQLFQKSLVFERKIKNVSGETDSLSYLTIAALKLKKIKKAEDYSAQSLLLAETISDSAIKARAFYSAGEVEYQKDKIAEMIGFQEKALTFYREAQDKSGEAETLTNLAYGYVMDNNRLKGKETAQAAVNLQKELNNQRGLAFALIALGDTNARIGDWEQGLISFKEAEKLYPEDLDLYDKAILLDRFGTYYETFGEYKKAQKYYQKAQLLFAEINNESGSSQLITVLGQISAQLGENDAAFSYYLQGLRIAERSKNLVAYGLACRNIGDVYKNKGDFPLALNYYQKALNASKKVGIKQPIALVYEKIGKLYEIQKDHSAARKNYLLALQINAEIYSKVNRAHNHQDLATIDTLENDTESALNNIRESINFTEDLQNNILNSQLRQSHFENIFNRYEMYIDLLMKMHEQHPDKDYARIALQASEKSRARLLLENIKLSGTDFIKDANPELVKREVELRALFNRKTNEFTDALSKNAPQEEIDKLDDELDDLCEKIDEIKATLKQNSPIYSSIKNPEDFDIADFQNNVLDDNSLLIEFSFGKEKSYVWTISKTEIKSYVLPPREVVETQIERLREILESRSKTPNETLENYQARIKESESRYWQEAHNLSSDLFGKFADEFGKKRLIIVTDGKLHYFPVSSLPLPNSQANEPLLLSNEVVYEPSATTLKIIKTARASRNPPNKNLLVFADPVFSKNDSRLGKHTENSDKDLTFSPNLRFAESLKRLQRLEASEDEAQTISQISDASKSVIRSGFAATRNEIFSSDIYDYKILHFATHGLTNDERPELSRIILSAFDAEGKDLDSAVRLQDIYGLNLSTDLVVLSACETGIGKEVKGEGLMSFNNAFLQAGAKSVVSSLWKVDDAATGELMKYFYEELASGKYTTSESLRHAQIKMWNNPQYNSPFYWAAFTIEGDFQNSPQIINNSFRWLYLLLILPPVSLGFYFGYRIIQRRKYN